MAEKLALYGGAPVRASTLPYARQMVGEDDVQAVTAALRSDWLTTGPLVEAFERAMAAIVEAKHAVAVASGTAALHAAVAAAGVGPGDEVVVPALTFAASANAVVYQGGTPVFADIRPDTLNVDPEAVTANVTSRTRALLTVDFAGQPSELNRLGAIARNQRLTLIEDGAHALGASYQGRPIGGIADLTTLSFHPAKLITTAEGGMVTTSQDHLAARLRRFRNHGLESDFRERAAKGAPYSPMVDLGYNYRLNELQCALGLSQLGRLDSFLKRRSDIAERYTVTLAEIATARVPAVLSHGRHAWHIYPVLLELDRLKADRDTILTALRAEGIGATVHYVPVYWHPFYEARGYRRGLCPRAEAAYERLLTLPLFPAMTDRDVDDVVAALAKVLRHFAR